MNNSSRTAKARATSRGVTLADVCRAIAEGDIPARQQGQWYAIRKSDLVNYASRFWSGPTLVGRAS